MEVYALRENNKKTQKHHDYIAIRSDDGYLYLNIPVERIKKALKEFKTGEEFNVNI